MVLQPIADLEVVVADELGRVHRASVVGVPRSDGLWDGFIAFRDEDGVVHVTSRQTTQPDAGQLFSWASGLSACDLEQALLCATDDGPGAAAWFRPAASV